MVDELDIKNAINFLNNSITKASSNFNYWIASGDDFYTPDWEIETCYLRLLAIVEQIGLKELHKMILTEYEEKKSSKNAFKTVDVDANTGPYSIDIARLRQLYHTVEQFYPIEDSTKVTKDIIQILRDVHYTITDKKLFSEVPQSEQDVHYRIEGILKCIFPDLKHKPALTKSIKNFEPDTGIPSIQTLIEYKFLSCADDCKNVADQILADTRAYISKGWRHVIYVIYETNRFKPEKEWIQLIRESGVPDNTKIIVLSGEPVKKHKKKTSVNLAKNS